MRRFQQSRGLIALLAAFAVLLFAAAASAEIHYYKLKDHPDGAQNPPPYGLRFDGLFKGMPGASGGVTSFSVEDNGAATWASYDDTKGVIRIFGTLYGGEDAGTTVGFGAGLYRVDMVYNTNVAGVGNGVVVTGKGTNKLQNHGRLWSLDNASTKGRQFKIYDYVTTGNSFLLLKDGHRLPSAQSDTWVGRGWLTMQANHAQDAGTRDWLFVAEPLDCAAPERAYKVTHHFNGHGLWFPGLYDAGKTVTMHFRDDVRFTVNAADTSATLTGTAFVVTNGGGTAPIGEEWTLDYRFTYRGVGDANGGPKIEQPALQPDWLNDGWEYWDFTTGTMTKPGSTVTLTQRPANSQYPFQLGDSANNKNERYGASMWMWFTRTESAGGSWTGIGDLNAEFIPVAPPADCCPPSQNYDLGEAAGKNVFVCGNYTGGLDVQGKVAVAGDASFLNFSIGTGDPGGTALVVGGTATLENGTVGGDAFYGTAGTATLVNFDGGEFKQGSPIDFGKACGDLTDTSAALCGAAANGSTVVHPWGGIELNGSDAVTNVFTLTGVALSGATSLTINAPLGSTVLVNVTGAGAIDMGSFGFVLNGVERSGVLFNICGATTLNVANVSFQGSLLAPGVDVTFNNGNFQGTLIAGSLDGTGEPHHFPFDNPIQIASDCGGTGGPAPLCSVDWDIVNQWPGGFQASVSVHYDGPPMTWWLLDWVFESAEAIAYLWNGAWSQSGAGVWVYNVGWNGTISKGSTIEIGFIGIGTPAPPKVVWLNGTKCQLAP